MIRYIKSLHVLVNGSHEYGGSLDEERINNLILERYSLERKIEVKNNLTKLIDKQE